MPISRCELFPLLAVCAGLTGCGAVESYPAIALTDRRLAEFGDMHSIQREKLGLPPLPSTGKVEVERSSRADAPYDAMLHVYAQHQSRTIAFRRRGEELKWIHEQVTVYGPRQFTDVDGTFTECVTFTYETSRVADFRLNRLNVSYHGPDANLSAKSELTLADVKPLLDQWIVRR